MFLFEYDSISGRKFLLVILRYAISRER